MKTDTHWTRWGLLALTVVFAFCLPTTLAAEHFPPDEDRARALALIKKLEENPLYGGAEADRNWLVSWLSKQPDSGMSGCGEPLARLINSSERYADIVFLQSMFSVVPLILNRETEPLDSYRLTFASVEAALRTYSAIKQADPTANLAVMEELARKQASGELDAYVREMYDVCQKARPWERPGPKLHRDPETGHYASTVVDAISSAVETLRADQVPELRKNAEVGDPKAELVLGAAYLFGEVVPANPEEGIKWLLRAAEDGSIGAQTLLGTIAEEAHNYVGAKSWYEKAAEQGGRDAQFHLGLIHKRGLGLDRNYQEAHKWFAKAAESGSAEAQYELGDMYESGLGVPEEVNEAVRWYRKAAQGGHLEAQVNLAEMLLLGQGVPQDVAEAAKWYHWAAEQGHVESQYQFATMLLEARGTAKDLVSAYAWLTLAANGGKQQAKQALAALHKDLTEKQRQAAENRVTNWLKQHPRNKTE